MQGLKQRGTEVYNWFEQRLGLTGPIRESAEHPIPAKSASWWYVFGSAATVIFTMQIVTGILLGLVYTPTASDAWKSLQFLNHDLMLGWYLRALHGWGSDFMVAIVIIHMVQVFLFGAYKFPRELTWIIGVFLLLMTLGMAFTGQVLRFDQDAYWGLGIGASIMSRVPILGPKLVPLLLGGPFIGGATLSRFFALHVFVIPGILILCVVLHVWMVLRLGINEWPMPGRVVRRSTYLQEYNQLTHDDGMPFVPDGAWKDAVFAVAIILAIMACAFYFGPFGPTGQPDPTIIQASPRPDPPFYWLFAILSFLPASMETPFLMVAPVIGIGIMLLLPLFAAEGEKHWSRRPVAVLMVSVIAVSLATFTGLGKTEPWSPEMNAWSSDPVPAKFMHELTPVQRQGAVVFQAKQCRNCHELGGVGGQRGPALDEVASKLTEDQLVRQVLQGGGNMPAYGNALNPEETTALVKFLETLRGSNQGPAQDFSRQLSSASSVQSTPDIAKH